MSEEERARFAGHEAYVDRLLLYVATGQVTRDGAVRELRRVGREAIRLALRALRQARELENVAETEAGQ